MAIDPEEPCPDRFNLRRPVSPCFKRKTLNPTLNHSAPMNASFPRALSLGILIALPVFTASTVSAQITNAIGVNFTFGRNYEGSATTLATSDSGGAVPLRSEEHTSELQSRL